MNVNRSQQFLEKTHAQKNGVVRALSNTNGVPADVNSSGQAFAEKATGIIRQYPATALISGFVVGGLLGWFASRSR